MLKTTAVQSEVDLPFTGLHQVLLPVFAARERLSNSNRETIDAVFGNRLAADDGRTADAVARVEAAVEEAPRGAVRGMALQTLGQLLEDGEGWEAAAAAHLEASRVAGYPLRGFALADAARTRARSGDPAGALELYDRFERDYTDLELPEHQQLEMLELRAQAAAPQAAPER